MLISVAWVSRSKAEVQFQPSRGERRPISLSSARGGGGGGGGQLSLILALFADHGASEGG